MRKINTTSRIILLLFLILFYSNNLFSATIFWDLNAIYGISQSGFASIISDSRNHFSESPNDTIIIYINPGTYNIGGNGSYGINLSGGINPGPNGRLIFQGAGMDLTTLIFTDIEVDEINANNLYRTTFKDMHMTRDRYTVTQGNVVSVAPGEIVIDLHTGFPTPLQLWKDWDQGRYLRRYTNEIHDPQIIQINNEQEPFGWRNGQGIQPQLITGNRWKFFLNSPTKVLSNYQAGDLVGIKSKFEGGTYRINRGSDIVFENIKWTHSTRGVTRNGVSNFLIKGCRIERGAPINGQTPCMASPSGGPQMNQLSSQGDTVATNIVVEDLFVESTGDDCVAFFNVNGGKVLNCTFRNSFARGLMISQEAINICANSGTTLTNSFIEKDFTNTPYWNVADAIIAGIITHSCDSSIYIFNGNGNWDFSANWMNGLMPPSNLTNGKQIIIAPIPNGQCILNITQTIGAGCSLRINQDKRMTVLGDLDIK